MTFQYKQVMTHVQPPLVPGCSNLVTTCIKGHCKVFGGLYGTYIVLLVVMVRTSILLLSPRIVELKRMLFSNFVLNSFFPV